MYPGELTLEWEEGYVHWVQFGYTTQWAPASGWNRPMAIDASTNWTVTQCSGWIELASKSGEAGEALAYTVPANPAGKEREGTVTLQAGNSKPMTLTVRQHILDFATTKEEALDRAWRENKRILLLYGREECGNTLKTMFSSLPAVKAALDGGFVLWYSNCDRQEEARGYAVGAEYPTVAILDPADVSTAVAATHGYQSPSALASLMERHAGWPGLPEALLEIKSLSATSATVATKVRASGSGAPNATVTLEKGTDAAFTGVESSRRLGTVTEAWTEQEWTFGPPSASETAFYRVRVSSGKWSVVSKVVEFVPLEAALDNAALAFSDGGASRGWGRRPFRTTGRTRCSARFPGRTERGC